MIEVKEGRYCISGPLTLSNVVQLRTEGLTHFASGSAARQIDVDLSQVTEVDSAAISLLFEWRRILSKQGRTLRLIEVTSNMRSLASVYEVQELLPTS